MNEHRATAAAIGPPAARAVPLLQAAAAMAMVGGAVTASGFLTDYPRFSAQAVRYGLAALVLVIVSRRGGRRLVRRPRGSEWWWLIASASAGLSGYNLAVLSAVDHAEPAVIGTVVACVPLVLAVAVPLVGRRRPPRRLLVGALVVVVGAMVVQGGGRTNLLGVLWSVIALAGETSFTLLALPVLGRLGAFSVAAHTAWIAAIQLAVLAAVIDGSASFVAPTQPVIFAVAYLVAASAGAFVLWFICVDRIGGELAGLTAGIIPVAAALTGLPFGRTTIAPSVIGGSLLVAIGVTLGLRPPGRPREGIGGVTDRQSVVGQAERTEGVEHDGRLTRAVDADAALVAPGLRAVDEAGGMDADRADADP
jgi:drug/metabolite transporter (DMT)-like permease